VSTATAPTDAVTITVSTRSVNDNSIQTTAQNTNLLDRTKDAILAAGVNKDEILPGYSNSLMNYRSVFFNTSNNTRICKDTVTNIVSGQMILRMKMDESRINRTLEAVRSTGAAASIFGYSLSSMKETVDDARKKAFDDAMQTAQDYASTFGFSLGKVMALMEPRPPDVETVPQVEAGFPCGTFGSYGMPNRFWMEPFWGMSRDREIGQFFD
jgi:uncharacterized protein YggE